MRIALVSAEYVGDAFSGGIGTYMRNTANMMARRGHSVEVFSGGRQHAHYREASGALVNIVGIAERCQFPNAIVPVFLKRHRIRPFDVCEGAEFEAETAGIAQAAPALPLVLKLHTPSTMLAALGHDFVPAWRKARFILGGLARGKRSTPHWIYDVEHDRERLNLAKASLITAPCRAIVEDLTSAWKLDPRDVSIVPNVFEVPQSLLSISANTTTNVVSYMGRLEMRKGVFDFATAIPMVLKHNPSVRFRFVGRSLPHPGNGCDIGTLLKKRLRRYSHAIEFAGGVPYDEMPQYYAATDICAFPSIWENFPNVCLEAMAAARGVVGSNAGGMAEIIEHGRTGLLVSPQSPRAVADAIMELLEQPDRRIAMGLAARAHVLSAYSPDVIEPLHEESYLRAIKNGKARPETSEN
jgi:glycogen synthase